MEVKCPICKKMCEFGPDNLFRPFCGERCQLIDLGTWADEKYRVPVTDPNALLDLEAELEDAESLTPPKR